jgi:CubicO group peptidase (beta-lactamase class C family)
MAVLGVTLLATLGASPYLRRWALLRTPDVNDYERLPGRTVPRGAKPYRFPVAPAAGDWVSPLHLDLAGRPIPNLEALDAFLAEHGTTAFIVIQDGRLVSERYFNGFKRDSLFKSFSVSKSVLSALVGIAAVEGRIQSLDDPVTRYVPEMQDPAFQRVTLRHCLNGTAGIRYSRGIMPWLSQPRMYYTTDVRTFLLGSTLAAEPGTTFAPEEISPLILGLILERVLARPPVVPSLSAFLAERIWIPMGAEYDAIWNLDHDGDGMEKTESGFCARAIDLAKLAQLYLQGGRWVDRQLVPADWVEQSTSKPGADDAPDAWQGGFYENLWWGRDGDAETRPDFYANGHFGQRLYVSPRKNLVLVRMGERSAGVGWTDFLAEVARSF